MHEIENENYSQIKIPREDINLMGSKKFEHHV